MHEIGSPRPISVTWKMQEGSDSMYSSVFMLKNICKILPKAEQTHKKLWILFQFSSGLRRPIIGTKFRRSCVFGGIQLKLWYHIFSSMKMEECMESELPHLFRVKLVAKNIVLGSARTQRGAVFVVWCPLQKKQTNFFNQAVRLKCFPC